MRELLRSRIPAVMEPNCIRQRCYGCFIACQKMPAAFRARVAVHRKILLLRRGGVLRGVSRIKAHSHDFELLPRIELHHLQRMRNRLQHLAAQHRAIEVHERQNYWPSWPEELV